MMVYTILLVCLSLFVASYSCNPTEEYIVQLRLGKISAKNVDGYYSFTNIPYAEPPTGSRRFEPPLPYNQTWAGVRDGSKPAIVCVTFGASVKFSGIEDCLYVNVFTPSIKCKRYYPVRLHIHGGAYMRGSSFSSDPSILVKNGMVVVTFGYRLGPLGFLSTGDSVIPGNNGLKDQRLAIKWTKDNIQSFCGDSNKILLAGESAGGASAHLHLLQKSTEKYINAIASHNGVTTCPWAFETKPSEICQRFADNLNCSMTSLKSCLQSKSVEDLREATSRMQYFKGNPFTVFAPVVEASDSEDPFLTEHPENIMRSGKAANITWLVAYTEREGTCSAAQFLSLDENGTPEINILNKQWSEVAPILLFYNNTMERGDKQQYSDYLRRKYLGTKDFSEKTYRLLENMYTDVLFKNDIEQAIELHRKYCIGKVYVYYYTYPHKRGIGNILCSRSDITFGADHMADTIFTMPLINLIQKTLSDKEKKISNNLIELYKSLASSEFAEFGRKRLPLNTEAKKGRLVINENCFSMDSTNGESVCYKYD